MHQTLMHYLPISIIIYIFPLDKCIWRWYDLSMSRSNVKRDQEEQQLKRLVRVRFNLPASAKVDLRRAAGYIDYLGTSEARLESFLHEMHERSLAEENGNA